MNAEIAYLFRHALLRDAAYQLHLPSARAKLHLLALEIIEDVMGVGAEALAGELAAHAKAALAEPAGPAQRERLLNARMKYLRISAVSFRRSYHNENARQALLELAAVEGVPGELRFWAHKELALLLSLMGKAEESSKEARAALQHAGGHVGPLEQAVAWEALGSALIDSGKGEEAINAYERGLEFRRREAPDAALAETLTRVGFAHLRNGDLESARKSALLAHEVARELGDLAALASARSFEGVLETEAGAVESGLAKFQEALGLALQRGDELKAATYHGYLGHALWWSGRSEQAVEHYDMSLAIHRKTGNTAAIAVNTGNRAAALKELNRIEPALEGYETALAMNREMGNLHGIAVNLINLSHLLSELGRFANAEALAAEAVEIAKSIGSKKLLAGAIYARAGLAEDRGELSAAEPLFAQAAALQRELGMYSYLAYTLGDWARLLERLEKPLEAMERVRECMDLAQKNGDSACVVQYSVLQARLASVFGRNDEAGALLESAWREAKGAATHPPVRYFELALGLARWYTQNGRHNEAVDVAHFALAKAREASVTESNRLLLQEALDGLNMISQSPK